MNDSKIFMSFIFFSIILKNGLILPECQVNVFYVDLKFFTHIKLSYILYVNIYEDI